MRFVVISEVVEHRVESAGRLSGGDHVHVQSREDLRVCGQSFSERRALLNPLFDVDHYSLQPLVLELVSQRQEGGHEWQACIRERCQQPGSEGQVAQCYSVAAKKPLHILALLLGSFSGLLDVGWKDVLRAQPLPGCADAVGLKRALELLAGGVERYVFKYRHSVASLQSPLDHVVVARQQHFFNGGKPSQDLLSAVSAQRREATLDRRVLD